MLSPTEEQQILRDSAARLVRDATAKELPQHRDPPPNVWSSAAEMGWLALPFDEADGGLGGGAADICALTVELGRGLLVGSYVVNTILPGRLVAAAPPSPLRAALLDDLISGTRTLAVADAEPQSRGIGTTLATHASSKQDGWILEGRKANVWVREETRTLLVSTVAAGAESQELLLAVPIDAPGLTVRRFHTVDGGDALDCTFDDAPISPAQVLIPPAASVRELRESACDLASVAMVAECVGMMKALIERTAGYLRSRKQFGEPLAKFQVLRHRMAEMALVCRRAEVLSERAARQFATLPARERSRLVSAACVKGLSGARFVCEQSVQLHGGMGVTAEVPVGRYLRRVLALEATFGSPAHHRARFQETDPA